jgi:AcrR family transcriptional regulator
MAAAEVFADVGYAGASVEAIVNKAEMSRRTFYEHFDDLGGVLLAVHDGSAAIARRLVDSAMEAQATPLERIRGGIEAFLVLLADNANLARVLFREVRAAGPQYEKRRDALLRHFSARVLDELAAAHAAGDLARAPDELTVYAVVCAVEAVAMRFIERGQAAKATSATPALVHLATSPFR